MSPAPIVYTGPSLSHLEAVEALPGADLRPPIRRWDLYRDREAGGSLFVILDGVFFQDEAVSPREILDVLADGGLVVGASSMGALRAAECWPAGMIGIGAIYRLFRRGQLTSDDEVAVTFAPDGDRQLVSVPLINVRYAASRAVRQGWMDRDSARRLVRGAEKTFYAERTWPELLARADCPEDLEARLTACDLKRKDGLRALRYVVRRLAANPSAAVQPRRGHGPFVPRDGSRERGHDVFGASDPGQLKHALARWHLLSGRGMRFLLSVAAVHPELQTQERLQARAVLGPLFEQRTAGPHRTGTARAATLRLALFDLWAELSVQEETMSVFAEGLWAELKLNGDLDAEVLRWRAVQEAASLARSMDLAPRERDRYQAEMEIATAHGFPSWRELRKALRGEGPLWSSLLEVRDRLALSKRTRDWLFNPPRVVRSDQKMRQVP